MRHTAWLVLALSCPRPAAADAGALTVYDRVGNLITISNRSQAGGSSVEIVSANRYGSINWTNLHQDKRVEHAYSATVDAVGNIYIAGGRAWQGSNYFWLMKLSSRGDLLWETAVHGWPGCYAFWVAANAQGSVWAAGACQSAGSYPMMVVRFDSGGNPIWTQRFSQGARNYLRAMSLDFLGHASIIVEVGQGNYSGTSNRMITVVYDQNGNQVASY